MITTGDCLDVMAAMDANSVDAIVTDPPYGLEFMGKEWDRLTTRTRGGTVGRNKRTDGTWAPVEYGIGAARSTYQCDGCGKKDKFQNPHGCESPTWTRLYLDADRSYASTMQAWHQRWATEALRVAKPGAYLLAFGGTRTYHRLACAIEDAGWIIRDCLVWAYASGFPKSKASLKPAWEPIVMARKPGPLRELAIDACRIGLTADDDIHAKNPHTANVQGPGFAQGGNGSAYSVPLGRWPANVVLTDPIFDGGIAGVVGGGEVKAGVAVRHNGVVGQSDWVFGGGIGEHPVGTPDQYGDTGTYSRFFIISKADRAEREPVFGGLTAEGSRVLNSGSSGRTLVDGVWTETHSEPRKRANHHPTVKPLDLMRHLVRLVTPIGGTVLDPFLGSGTTAIAAEMEGFAWLGIEREAEYVAIAEARLQGVQRGLGLAL